MVSIYNTDVRQEPLLPSSAQQLQALQPDGDRDGRAATPQGSAAMPRGQEGHHQCI